MKTKKRHYGLGIILIDFKTPDQTIKYIKTVIRKLRLNYMLVVLNNTDNQNDSKIIASQIGALNIVDNQKPLRNKNNKFVLTSGENLGFARGNNFAFDFMARHFSVDYLLFSNNDLSIQNPTKIIQELMDVLETKPDVGAVGPTVKGSDHFDRNPFDYWGLWRFAIGYLFNPLILIITTFKKDFNIPYIQNASSGYCYKLTGCFMMVREKVFRQCGGFDNKTFLYMEEAILSEHMLRKGFKTYYCKTPVVLHHEGFTTRQFLESKSKARINFDSNIYYYHQYKKVGPIPIFLARFSFLLYSMVYLRAYAFIKNIKKISKHLFYG